MLFYLWPSLGKKCELCYCAELFSLMVSCQVKKKIQTKNQACLKEVDQPLLTSKCPEVLLLPVPLEHITKLYSTAQGEILEAFVAILNG